MNRKRICAALAVSACLLLLAGCVSSPRATLKRQIGESVVCVGEQPAALAWIPVRGQPLSVRSTYLPAGDTVEYVEGRDYTVDYATGTLRRTPNSRIPDYRTNMLYGVEGFDHSKFPGYGNTGFLAYVDYSYKSLAPWPVQAPQIQFLKRTRAKLERGQPVKIVAFGDSITAGGQASTPDLIFWERWTQYLQHKYPACRITAINGATGGDTTAQGLARLQAKVLDQHPDLVLIGFGMNDHNVPPFGVPLPQFEQNLKELIARIRKATSADIILFSAFPPNPKWKFGSHHMQDYAAATQRVAREEECAYADVFDNWQKVAARKKPEDLLGNDINHPDDFGHWIYYQVLTKVGL